MPTTVSTHMTNEPITLMADDPLRAAVEIELQKRIHHILVVDTQRRLIGIITDRDIKRALNRRRRRYVCVRTCSFFCEKSYRYRDAAREPFP